MSEHQEGPDPSRFLRTAHPPEWELSETTGTGRSPPVPGDRFGLRARSPRDPTETIGRPSQKIDLPAPKLAIRLRKV